MALDLPPDLRARVDAARAEMEAERASLPADEEGRSKVLSHCHAALAGRQLTRHDLEQRLLRRDHPRELVDWALERCDAAGLIDDAAWARAYVASRLARGQGERRIRANLSAKGIERVHVDAAFEAAGGRERASEACVELVRRRYGSAGLADEKVRAKAMRYLAGRGYDAGQVHDAIRTVRAEAGEAG